jgi:hypothetical protein
MFRRIVIVLFGLIACLAPAHRVVAQQTAAGKQPPGGGGRGPGGYVNVSSFELFGTPAKRGGGH